MSKPSPESLANSTSSVQQSLRNSVQQSRSKRKLYRAVGLVILVELVVLAFTHWVELFSGPVAQAMLDHVVVDTVHGPQYLQVVSVAEHFWALFEQGILGKHLFLAAQLGATFAVLVLTPPALGLYALHTWVRARFPQKAGLSKLSSALLAGLAVTGLSFLSMGVAKGQLSSQVAAYEKSLLAGGFSQCGPVSGVARDGSLRMVELFQLDCDSVALDAREHKNTLAYIDVQKTMNYLGVVEPLGLCSTSGAYERPSLQGVLEIPICHAKGGPAPQLAQVVSLSRDCSTLGTENSRAFED